MKNKQEILKIIELTVQFGVILFLLVFAALSFFPRLNFFSKRGFNFYAVISGSMEPAIKTGSLIYAGPYDLDKLKKGDVITFKIKNEEKEMTVTHRIYSIIRNEKIQIPLNSNKSTKPATTITYDITTKGDANANPDTIKPNAGDILGLYKFSIPFLGYVTTFSHTRIGFIVMIIVPGMILIFWELFNLIQYFKSYYEKKAEEKFERMMNESKKKKSKK